MIADGTSRVSVRSTESVPDAEVELDSALLSAQDRCPVRYLTPAASSRGEDSLRAFDLRRDRHLAGSRAALIECPADV
jgi:hypothetical protein